MARVAILATNGFEESELASPLETLREAGHQADVISPEEGTIKAWNHDHWSKEYTVDRSLDNASPDDYDMLVLPGGQMNPDNLRLEENAIGFIREIGAANKPIAAICHGPWTLIDAGLAKGHRMTSWPSVRCDLENAGADWVDQKLVEDGNLITSRKPDDLPAFNDAILSRLGNT